MTDVPNSRKRTYVDLSDEDDEEPEITWPTQLNKRQKAKEEEKQRVQAEAQKVLKRKADLQQSLDRQRLTKRPSVPGTRGDGNFYARIFDVGQGNCVILSTPAGRSVLVDCGTLSTDGRNRAAVVRAVKDGMRDKKFLGTSSHLDALVVSHFDGDHHEYLPKILNGVTTVGAAYHQGGCPAGATADLLTRTCKLEDVFTVTHNRTAGSGEISLAPADTNVAVMVTAPAPVGGVTPAEIRRLDAGGGILIVAEPDCTVAILAANVRAAGPGGDTDAADMRNRRSLVLLVEALGRKLVLLGDATMSTEHYLLTSGVHAVSHKARLTNVDVTQIAHHGSTTSTGDAFVNVLRPKEAVVSAGRVGVTSHRLPRRSVLNRYVTRLADQPDVDPHTTFYWDDTNTAGLPLYGNQNLTKAVYSTGSYGDFDITWTKS